MFEKGQRVQAVRMPDDSHYSQVIGAVRSTRNGFVQIEATHVMSRWSIEGWMRHPTSCVCATRVEHVRALGPATYDPDKTEHRQAAARCGFRLKRVKHLTVALVDDKTGEIVFEGSRDDSWRFMRNKHGLCVGPH